MVKMPPFYLTNLTFKQNLRNLNKGRCTQERDKVFNETTFSEHLHFIIYVSLNKHFRMTADKTVECVEGNGFYVNASFMLTNAAYIRRNVRFLFHVYFMSKCIQVFKT